MPSVRFAPGIVAAIGFTSLSREDKVKVCARVAFDLEKEIEIYRSQRVKERPDCFRFEVVVPKKETLHLFTFHVLDTDPDLLLVVEAQHEQFPAA